MKVNLLHHTPECLLEIGYRVCYDSFAKSKLRLSSITPVDTVDLDFILRHVKNGHHSPLEHCVFSFSVEGMKRSVLQHIARHRIASLSVKSTRYTLTKFIDAIKSDDVVLAKSIVQENTGLPDECVNNIVELFMSYKQFCWDNNIEPNADTMKDCIPEAWQTNMVWTINLRSLCNFMSLRLHKSAMPATREFATAVYEQLPNWAKAIIITYMERAK